jgi:hypothetical protein
LNGHESLQGCVFPTRSVRKVSHEGNVKMRHDVNRRNVVYKRDFVFRRHGLKAF